MNSRLLIGVILSSSVFLVASDCEKRETPDLGGFSVGIELVKQGEPAFAGEAIPIDDATEVRIDELRFYLSHIRLMRPDSSLIEIVDYILYNLTKSGDLRHGFEVPDGSYIGLVFNLGLDSAQNAQNPTVFPSDDDLSAAAGMYWTWATQYRFVLTEGKSNNLGQTGQPNDGGFAYHPGGNHLYQEDLFFPYDFNAAPNLNTSLTLKIDVQQWFYGPAGSIDVRTENAVHDAVGQQELALRFIQNFAASLSL
ncbi:hypothetical protein GC167_02485 [bacterium]|nr:hypothetical protein [bacterium]